MMIVLWLCANNNHVELDIDNVTELKVGCKTLNMDVVSSKL